jgi:hypothetical protein
MAGVRELCLVGVVLQEAPQQELCPLFVQVLIHPSMANTRLDTFGA